MTHQHQLVSDWASQWACDPAGLAARYAETATLAQPATTGATGSALGGATLTGRDAIAQDAARLAIAVPDRRVELLRLVDAGRTVVAEWMFTGRSVEDLVTMATLGLTWWELDDDGRIADELRLVDWSARRIADAASRPDLAAAAGATRSHGWYRDFTDRLFEVVGPYPELARSSLYRSSATRTRLVERALRTTTGDGATGTGAGHDDAPASPLPTAPAAVAGDGSLLAIRFDPDGSGLRDAVAVLELDESDRIVDERSYHGTWWPEQG